MMTVFHAYPWQGLWVEITVDHWGGQLENP